MDVDGSNSPAGRRRSQGAEHFAVDALCIPAIEALNRFREKLTVMFSAEAA
jgi:hypothetical protein